LFRKLLSIIAFGALIVLAVPMDGQALPKLKIDNPDFDFGYVPEGLTVVHPYWAHNVGTDTMVIYRVRASCRCTAVRPKRDLLAPGDSLVLEMKFDTKKIKGKVAKHATVECSDLTREFETLRFTAQVGTSYGVINVTPEEVYLDTIGKTEQVVTLRNATTLPYLISIASPMAEFMNLSFSSMDLPPRGEITMTVKTTPEAPPGEYHASVTLHIEGAQPHNITIPVLGRSFPK